MSLIILIFSLISSVARGDVFLREKQRVEKILSTHPNAKILLGDELKNSILQSLSITKTGRAIESEIKRLSTTGFEKLKAKKLQIGWMINRANGPLAEYTNDGEISLNASVILGIPKGQIHKSKKMIESFLVHEMTHAIVHDLATRGLFSPYDPATKMNEFLAYRIQGQYIEELEAIGVAYDERVGTPVWDQHSHEKIGQLKKLGINQNTPDIKVRDILDELLIGANSDSEMKVATDLISFYDFLNSSQDKDLLWVLDEENSSKVQSSVLLFGLIKEDLNSDKFNHFFNYLSDRIPLYSHYPDLPYGLSQDIVELKKYINKLDEYLFKIEAVPSK